MSEAKQGRKVAEESRDDGNRSYEGIACSQCKNGQNENDAANHAVNETDNSHRIGEPLIRHVSYFK